MSSRRHTPNVWRGLVVGAAAGVVAAWAMERFQAAAAEKLDVQTEGEPSNVQAADALAKATLGAELRTDKRRAAGEAVHYAFGAAVGALYGALVEVAPRVAAGFGALYGLAVAAVADEGAVPALGLGPKPQDTPLKVHAYGLASHAAYGAALEAARRTLRVVF